MENEKSCGAEFAPTACNGYLELCKNRNQTRFTIQ